MSVFDENIHAANPGHQIDRLVDGELSESDRRNLLLQLEHEPDGWRRCALAFLEAQCWKAELGQIAAPTGAERIPSGLTVASPAVRPEPSEDRETLRQNWRQRLAMVLTVAASFLIALFIGRSFSGTGSGGSPHSPENSVVRSAVQKIPLSTQDAASSPQAANNAVANNVVGSNGWEMVTLDTAKSADGQAETYCVPAQCRDALDQNMLEHMPDAISPEVQQAFERSGHRIVQQREIVPVQMKDGRRLVVPVDHIQIHYVGRPSL